MPHAADRQSLQAVVFDLDDTLYLERDYVRSGYRHVAQCLQARHGAPPEVGEWMWRRFCAARAANMFQAVSEHFRLRLDSAAVAALVEEYRAHRPVLEPSAEALEVLAKLRGRVKLGVLSDGFLPAQQLKLEVLRLAERFDAVVFTEELGRQFWKPHPAAFERIADLLHVPHAACAYVADNPSKDFIAPNALGWRTLQWVRDGQVHAGNAAPPGGEPQHMVRTTVGLLATLGF